MDSKKIINNLLNLPSLCDSFSNRNILEVLAIMEGEKKVVRVPIKSNEWKTLKVFCKDNDFAICHSNFKIAVVRKTTLGDIFTENVPWDSSSDKIVGFVAYISMKIEIAQLASDMELHADAQILGELYQYPKCCVENYSNKIESGEFWLDTLLINTKGYNHSFYSNKLAYLFDDTSIISDYFPCSLNCEETITIGKNYKEILLKNKMNKFYKCIESLLCKPIIVGDGFLLQLDKSDVEVNSINSQIFEWKNYKKHKYLHESNFNIKVDYELNKAFLDEKTIGKLYQFSGR